MRQRSARARSLAAVALFAGLALLSLDGEPHAPRSTASAFVLSGSSGPALAAGAVALVLMVYYVVVQIGLMPLAVRTGKLRRAIDKVEASEASKLFELVIAFGKQAVSPLGVHFTLVDPLSGEEDPAKYTMDRSLNKITINFPPADVEQYAKTFDIADIKLVDKFVGRGTPKAKNDCMVKMDISSRSIVLRLASKTDAEQFIKCVKILQKYNVLCE
eukprot:TRINITY_DN79372_c0_g1_i1.p1 TRINITY_DN79372_c0_g1~~TRINITY_DN79372_c0_g1_i1.p1  ORF type:complete len:216 (-),score=54.58 TRINITY_DN79372_c0_g1_i1:61-708(-)